MKIFINVLLTLSCILFGFLFYGFMEGNGFFSEVLSLKATVGDIVILRICFFMLILFSAFGIILLWRQSRIMNRINEIKEMLEQIVPEESVEEEDDDDEDGAEARTEPEDTAK